VNCRKCGIRLRAYKLTESEKQQIKNEKETAMSECIRAKQEQEDFGLAIEVRNQGPGRPAALMQKFNFVPEMIPGKPPPVGLGKPPPRQLAARKSPPTARKLDGAGRSPEFEAPPKNQQDNRADIAQWMHEQRREFETTRTQFGELMEMLRGNLSGATSSQSLPEVAMEAEEIFDDEE
ncbi:unnamed protein product, partial [Prorocentrum cordatum]